MKNIRSTFARFRFLNSLLLLVLMLVALKVTPVVHAQGCDWVCSGWTAKSGCTNCSWCCVKSTGGFTCEKVVNNNCGTDGPSHELID